MERFGQNRAIFGAITLKFGAINLKFGVLFTPKQGFLERNHSIFLLKIGHNLERFGQK